MKNILSITFVALLMASCSTAPEKGYVLTGSFSGEIPLKAYLQLYTEGEMKVLDSSEFSTGEFIFSGEVAEPDFYYLRIGGEKDLLGLFIENSIISIVGHTDSLDHAVVSGSVIQNQYNDYKKPQLTIDVELSELHEKYKQAKTEELKNYFETKYDSVDLLSSKAAKDYVIENNSSVIAPYIIRRELIYGMNLSELEEITNKLSPELIENKYTKQLYSQIKTLRILEPGMVAPEFSQNNTEDKSVKLADFKGKYLLIDFWASWCGPCRKANSTVVEIYNKYWKNNFTILGISMDSDKDKWLEAIETDGLTWTQVSALEGWKNPIAKMYAVNSIPHAILIDPEGKVVKRGIQASELDELLESLLATKKPKRPINIVNQKQNKPLPLNDTIKLDTTD
jgi:peroxiredoxin